MEENARRIHECAMATMMHVIERMERAGVSVPPQVRRDVYTACIAGIETYVIERNRMLRRLYPLGGN